MDGAVVVFSRQGLFKLVIKARDVSSREHARKLWPLIDSSVNKQMVTFVSPSFNQNGKLLKRSHFRLLPKTNHYDIKKQFVQEEAQRVREVHESLEHKAAKNLIIAELNRRLSANLALTWAFKDERSSDYPFEGNLLLGGNKIEDEYPITTTFGCKFKLDIAILGQPISKIPLILGGIEIERSHAFDGRKALICKSLGFPLVSVDISEMTLEEINPEWARTVLSSTTRSNDDGRRQTYIYLHDVIYPLYAQIPAFIDNEQRHQYLVFSDDETLNKLIGWISKLSKILEYPNGAVTPALVNGKSTQSKKMLERAGDVVGTDWKEFNHHQCLRITLPRSKGTADLQAHKFHMTLARILLSCDNALVGYKYCNGVDNDQPNEDVWIHRKWLESNKYSSHRILPKRLAEPISRLIKVVGELEKNRIKE